MEKQTAEAVAAQKAASLAKRIERLEDQQRRSTGTVSELNKRARGLMAVAAGARPVLAKDIDHGGRTVVRQKQKGNRLICDYSDGSRKSYPVTPDPEPGGRSIGSCRGG